jgi:hypothetical protein
VTETLCFRFADLHPDAPELREDLDWLLRFVARRFEIRVRDELLYEEVEFPVLELAQVLDAWMATDMAERHDLEYEVTGGENGTLLLRSTASGWLVDSAYRSPTTPVPALITDDELRHAISSFIEELHRETGRDYDLDVRALLTRVRADASS